MTSDLKYVTLKTAQTILPIQLPAILKYAE